jgi:DNA-binding MarR family transcriptional regulator
MARGKKKRRGKKKMVRHLTPAALREFWEALSEEDKPLKLRGEEINTLEELLAIHAREPREVDRELAAQNRAALREHDKRGKEINAEAKAKERELREAQAGRAFMERLQGLGVRELDDETVEALKGLPQSTLDVLCTIARLQRQREARGAGAFKVNEIGGALGMNRGEVERLLDFAERAGLASVDRASETLTMSITARSEEPSFDLGEPDPANLGLENQGVCTLPTTTLRHFSRIAREEGLPKALGEDALAQLAVLARHIVAGTEVLATEDGRHFIRAHLICAARKRLVDSPASGEYADAPLVDAVKDLLRPELPPVLEEIRQDWLASEWLRQESDGTWHWNLAAHEIESSLDEWELRNMGEPVQMDADLPLRQLGLLIEAGQWKPLPDDGEQMPIHAGARSFEAIWRRQSLLAETVRKTGKAVNRRGADREGTFAELMRPQIAWSARGMMAPAFLGEMRLCRTVAVDLDVAEGLPDWESLEEAWAYAQDSELPFPVTYFDFTTPGGYRPKVILQSEDGIERTLTLRAALCKKEGGYLRIAPFAWFEDIEHLPDELRVRNDYDVPGVVHFGLAPRLGDAGQLEDVTHLRLSSEEGLSAPSQMMLTQALLGQPGWVDLYSDLTANNGGARGEDVDNGAIMQAEAMIAVTAACRVLSVIYALDSTVNIELADAEPSRPERRAVDRALQRGRDALISKTVRIHPTRQAEARRETGAKREYSHAHWRRGHFAHYPLGTRMADRLAERDATKLVDHPVKGLCRKVYRPPTIVGATGPDGKEREPVAKSYVWGSPAERRATAAQRKQRVHLEPEVLLESVRERGRAGVPDLAEDLDVSKQTVRKVGDELAEEGKLEVVPGERGRGGRPREYVYVERAT